MKPHNLLNCNCLPCRTEREALLARALDRLTADLRAMEAAGARPRLRRVVRHRERRKAGWWLDEDSAMIMGDER